MNNFYVYVHYRNDNNVPFYVGKGSGNRYLCKKSRNQHWSNIVNKVGYRVEIIEDNLTEEESFIREEYYIKFFGREDLNEGTLVNFTNGGEGTSGFKHTNEWKKNHSFMMSGNKNPNYQNPWKHTIISKNKLSEKVKGKNNPNAKKVINIETGIIYGCVKEVADLFNIYYLTLINNLSGKSKNKTQFRYYEETPN